MKNSTHHIVPRSRGGTNGPHNLKKVDAKDHEAYHILFKNMTVDEIVGSLVSGTFHLKTLAQREAWDRLFGSGTGQAIAAEAIIEDWR